MKDVTAEALRSSVAAVAAGGTEMSPAALTGLAEAIRLRSAQDGPVLTERESEILVRIATGESVATIGRAIHASPATVKTHIAHIYDKLEVRERAAAVATAMRLGLLA
jgi:two-component system nitrate/nitrite response regulator NarL